MQREIDALSGHLIVCGYGRVGRAAAHQLSRSGRSVVVVDVDEERLAECPYLSVCGDSTDDDVLRLAGVEIAPTSWSRPSRTTPTRSSSP